MKTLKLILMCTVLGLGMMSLTGASALAVMNGVQPHPNTALMSPSEGLVAYWNFDQGAGTLLPDSSGNGHTGAINGATWVLGKFGQALSFDGEDDYVEVPDAADLSGWDQYTFEAWVYLRGLSQNNWQFVLEKPGSNQCQLGESYGFVWRQVGYLTPGDPDRIHSFYSNEAAQGFVLTYANESDGPIKPSELDYGWHHFAATYDGATYVGYLDGIQIDATPGSGSVRVTASPLYIGAGLGWCRMAAHFKGDIDELKIYSRARTPDEIAQDAGLYVSAAINLDPNTVNLKGSGKWITAYIELPTDYNPADIALESVRLDGTIPAVTDSKYGFVKNAAESLTDQDGDGVIERMVKFEAGAVEEHLKSNSALGATTLTVTGSVAGTLFKGQDTINVIQSK